jgi:prepilin-type N-terminal cleavage/methylation domain-containing protein
MICGLKSDGGFTLIEIAIVLAILGLFLSVAIPFWQFLLVFFIALMIAVCCGALWLIQQGIGVLNSGVFPSPGSSPIFKSVAVLTGAKAKRQGFTALAIGITILCLISGAFIWLAVRF